MYVSDNSVRETSAIRPNGSGAAAILSAGIGSFAIGLLAIFADQSVLLKSLFTLYKPTGPLSGVTTVAILIWLLAWSILEWRWRKRTVALKPIVVTSFVLLGLALVLTFPPAAELF